MDVYKSSSHLVLHCCVAKVARLQGHADYKVGFVLSFHANSLSGLLGCNPGTMRMDNNILSCKHPVLAGRLTLIQSSSALIHC